MCAPSFFVCARLTACARAHSSEGTLLISTCYYCVVAFCYTLQTLTWFQLFSRNLRSVLQPQKLLHRKTARAFSRN